MGSYGGPSRGSSGPGSSGGGSYADTAKRLAGRSLLAVGTACAKSVSAVAKGVSALTTSTSDKEGVRSLKFALVEWSDGAAVGGGGAGSATGASGTASCCGPQHVPPCRRLPVLLVGLESGFQVGAWPTSLITAD